MAQKRRFETQLKGGQPHITQIGWILTSVCSFCLLFCPYESENSAMFSLEEQ